MLNTSKFYFKYGYIYMIVVLLIIYICCTLIDKIMKCIYQKIKLNFVIVSKINNKFI